MLQNTTNNMWRLLDAGVDGDEAAHQCWEAGWGHQVGRSITPSYLYIPSAAAIR